MNVRTSLDKALSHRQAVVTGLQNCINDEIEDVRNQIKAVKQLSQVIAFMQSVSGVRGLNIARNGNATAICS